MARSINRYIKTLDVPNNGNFPYCTCTLIDDQVRVLIDGSCGSQLAAELRQQGLDVLILTHFHLDHTLNVKEVQAGQIWSHKLDADAIESVEVYQDMYGFNLFDGKQLGRLLVEAFQLEANQVNRYLSDREILDFGHVRLRVIHIPGHTPGQIALFDEETAILFSADIDLSPIGPWYGHLCSDLDDFLESIKKCMDLHPRLIIGGHTGVLEGDLDAKFIAYRDKILKKEEKILQSLESPKSIEDLAARHSFLCPKLTFASYQEYFNKHGVNKHLERLIKLGEVRKEDDLYFRV